MRGSLLVALSAVVILLDALDPRPVGSQSAGARGAGPAIFDAHIHYSAPDWSVYPPERILEILDRAGIKRALVSSTPDDGTLQLYEKAPTRIVPILRPYRTRDDMGKWWDDPTVISYLEERLRRRVHRGIGEFHLHGEQAGTPVIKRLTELAVRDNLVLHAHSDEAAIAELFRVEPRLRIIWAHAGMSSGPRVVGEFLDRHANLWVDLALRNSDVAPGGVLDPAWQALLTRHADRFLVGTDTWVTSRWTALPGSIDEVRRYLGQLPRDVAEKIAFKNAERLFP
ncbi:MAG TPA: amidohydrolase family protein [Methylomirabilota bacterium]|nr:amidohydrolase family protein [Methylomirabilota bacterium]